MDINPFDPRTRRVAGWLVTGLGVLDFSYVVAVSQGIITDWRPDPRPMWSRFAASTFLLMLGQAVVWTARWKA